MRHLNCILVILMVVVVGCQSENPVELVEFAKVDASTESMAGQERPLVPFHASETNTIVVVPPFIDETNPVGHFEFPGTASGTHIGASTILGIAEVDFSVFPFVETGHAMITAANGDVLTFGFAASAVPGPEEGDVVFTGEFWFTPNGTGRFANASGGGTLWGTANTVAAVGQYDMDGEIAFGPRRGNSRNRQSD
jgi:hypothetical protein